MPYQFYTDTGHKIAPAFPEGDDRHDELMEDRDDDDELTGLVPLRVRLLWDIEG